MICNGNADGNTVAGVFSLGGIKFVSPIDDNEQGRYFHRCYSMPAMTKIELGELKDALMSKKQVGIIVFFNYIVNPFLLYAIGYIFFEKILLGLG